MSSENKGILAQLLAGDNGQKIVMALIVLAGGGNLIQGHQAEKETREDFDRAIAEIHNIAGGYKQAIETQKQLDAQLKTAIINQQAILESIKRLEEQVSPTQKNP
jgi:predicted Zn-dependent protease